MSRGRRISKCCIVCGEIFQARVRLNRPNVCCSMKCSHIYQARHRQHKSCEICKKDLYVVPSRIKQRFCSDECRLIGMKDIYQEQVKSFLFKKGIHSSITTEFKHGDGGEKHWNWKGGITNSNRTLRQDNRYREWQQQVYKRDHYKCQECQIHCYPGNIIAHHIFNFSDYPELRTVVNNGITLCRKCHVIIHHRNTNNEKRKAAA